MCLNSLMSIVCQDSLYTLLWHSVFLSRDKLLHYWSDSCGHVSVTLISACMQTDSLIIWFSVCEEILRVCFRDGHIRIQPWATASQNALYIGAVLLQPLPQLVVQPQELWELSLESLLQECGGYKGSRRWTVWPSQGQTWDLRHDIIQLLKEILSIKGWIKLHLKNNKYETYITTMPFLLYNSLNMISLFF